MRNTYFVTCPFCGANLDPGERCDCRQEKEVIIMMTPNEKREMTRKKNQEARDKKELEKIRIREQMKISCLHVLEDPSASSDDRMKAIELLHELTKGR